MLSARRGARVWYDDQREVHRQIYTGDDIVDYAFMGTDPNSADNRWLLDAMQQLYHSNAPVKCPGKRPFGDEWEKRARADIPAVLSELPNPIATNTGILCDGLRAVDLDIDDETVVNQVFELAVDTLGDAPVRMRPNAPRLLLLYRAAVGEPGKIKIKGRDHSKERSMAIEILGYGQQFIAYGDHPSGVQLQWENGDPSTIERARLTAITEEQIYEFLENAARLIGHVPIDPLVSQSDYKGDHDWTDEEVSELMDYIPAYCADDRDLWIAIGQGLKAGGFSFNHFDRFSAQCTAKYKHNECLKTWTSLRPNHITFGTVVYWAKEGGWKPKPKAPQPTGHYKFDDNTTGFEELPLRGLLPQAMDDKTNVGPRPKPRRLRWPVEYLNLPPIDYWDDEQLFPRNPDGCTMMVVADFGNHKTNFVLSFCMNACLDKNARVLFIPCEGAYGLCTQRIPAHCADRGIPVDALTGRFGIIPEGLSLIDEKAIDGLIEESRDFNPSIIVIDTLGQAAPSLMPTVQSGSLNSVFSVAARSQ